MNSKRNNKARQANGGVILSTSVSTPISSSRPNPSDSSKQRKKRSKKQKQKQRRQQMQAYGPVSVAYGKHLSRCAALYLKAICDPFDTRLLMESPCIPDLLDQPSFRFYTLQRGTYSIGTAGVGYIQVSPFPAYSNDSNIVFSGSLFTGTVTAVSGVGVTFAQNTQFPWANTARRDVRTVACGLRVRYLGTALNQSGVSTPSCAIASGDTTNGLQLSDLLNRDDTIWYNNDRTWRGCTYRPMQATDYQYSQSNFSTTVAANCKMAVISTGVAGGQMAYEVVTFYEAIPCVDSVNGGLNAVPGVEKSETDIDGLSTARDFLGTVSNSEVGQAVWQSALNYLKANSVTYAASALGFV